MSDFYVVLIVPRLNCWRVGAVGVVQNLISEVGMKVGESCGCRGGRHWEGKKEAKFSCHITDLMI